MADPARGNSFCRSRPAHARHADVQEQAAGVSGSNGSRNSSAPGQRPDRTPVDSMSQPSEARTAGSSSTTNTVAGDCILRANDCRKLRAPGTTARTLGGRQLPACRAFAVLFARRRCYPMPHGLSGAKIWTRGVGHVDQVERRLQGTEDEQVLLLNDDYTTMSLCLRAPEYLPAANAEACRSCWLCTRTAWGWPVYPHEIAETRVAQVEALAREFEFRCGAGWRRRDHCASSRVRWKRALPWRSTRRARRRHDSCRSEHLLYALLHDDDVAAHSFGHCGGASRV